MKDGTGLGNLGNLGNLTGKSHGNYGLPNFGDSQSMAALRLRAIAARERIFEMARSNGSMGPSSESVGPSRAARERIFEMAHSNGDAMLGPTDSIQSPSRNERITSDALRDLVRVVDNPNSNPNPDPDPSPDFDPNPNPHSNPNPNSQQATTPVK